MIMWMSRWRSMPTVYTLDKMTCMVAGALVRKIFGTSTTRIEEPRAAENGGMQVLGPVFRPIIEEQILIAGSIGLKR